MFELHCLCCCTMAPTQPPATLSIDSSVCFLNLESSCPPSQDALPFHGLFFVRCLLCQFSGMASFYGSQTDAVRGTRGTRMALVHPPSTGVITSGDPSLPVSEICHAFVLGHSLQGLPLASEGGSQGCGHTQDSPPH